jgi:hypothetical protein
MTAVVRHARELDYVELLVDAGAWPAGIRGTVVWEEPETALVEVSEEYWDTDPEGFPMLDPFVDVRYGDLKVVEPYVPAGG